MNSSSNLRPTAPDVASRNPPTRYCSPKRGAVDLKLDRPAWLPGKAHRLDDPTGTGDRPAGPTVGRSSEHLLVGETVGAHSTGEAVWGPGRRPETSPTRATNSAPPVLRCGPPSRCAGATSSHPRPDCPHFSPVVEFRLFYEISLLARPLYHSTIGRPLLSSFLICKRIDRDLGSCLGAQPGHPSVSSCRRHRSPPNDFFNSATTTELTTAGSRCSPIVVCLLAQDLSLAWRGLILSWKGLVSTSIGLEFRFQALFQLSDSLGQTQQGPASAPPCSL